jgi:Rrf2 family nitric oxide-sensitive transcriptional repressor
MRLTAYTDYSLRVLIRLALRPHALATIGEIARAYEVSEHHLMKVVHQLGVAGYVETVRGRGGGLRLATEPGEINVGEVVRRMEPDFGLAACFRGSEHCAIESACNLAEALRAALAAFLQVLDRYTIADLIGKPGQLSALLNIKPAAPPRLRRSN